MGYQFSLVLSREINDQESTILREENSAAPIFGTDSLPTDATITVTKMDFDDTVSASLAEAIESALESVKKVPDLSVPSLTVPAQPAEPATENPPAAVGEIAEEKEIAEDNSGIKKASTRKPAAKRATTKKASKNEAAEPTATSSNGHARASANRASSA